MFICRSPNQGSALPRRASTTTLLDPSPLRHRAVEGPTQVQKKSAPETGAAPQAHRFQLLIVTDALCWCHFFLHPHLPQPHTAAVTGSFNPFLNHRVSPALQYRHRVTQGHQGKEHTHICIDVCAKHRCPVWWLVFTVGWTINPRKQFIQIYSLYQGSTGKQAAFFGDFKCLHLVCRWQQWI